MTDFRSDPPADAGCKMSLATDSSDCLLDTPHNDAPANPPGSDDDDPAQERSPGETGAPHSAVRVLQARSRLAQAMKGVPRYKNILIIDDEQRDSDRLASTLRTIFGYDIEIRQCRTLGTALDAVVTNQPDLIFLDDRLGALDKAEKSVPFLRTARCTAMIIVVSGQVNRRRRADVLLLGVGDVIDKDDLDSTSICNALIQAHMVKRNPPV